MSYAFGKGALKVVKGYAAKLGNAISIISGTPPEELAF